MLEIWVGWHSGTVLKGQGFHDSESGLRGTLACRGGASASGSVRAQTLSVFVLYKPEYKVRIFFNSHTEKRGLVIRPYNNKDKTLQQ
jgi:hypothetical protein